MLPGGDVVVVVTGVVVVWWLSLLCRCCCWWRCWSVLFVVGADVVVVVVVVVGVGVGVFHWICCWLHMTFFFFYKKLAKKT